MEFWKGHALGNDYLVVDATGGSAPAAEVIRRLCDRNRGVGADGVLVADRSGAPVRLRIFNPDGSEAEKSGNGLRIFGAWLHDQGEVGAAPFRVALPAETVELTVEASAADGTRTVAVDMGRLSFRAADVHYRDAAPDEEVLGAPLTLGDEVVEVHLVSVGNPHCVILVDRLDAERFRRVAPAIQALDAFERGVNVQMARRVDATTLEARIRERGAGETLASGTSACAVAGVARRVGLVEAAEVEVRMPGGSVRVAVDDEAAVRLTGAAQIVYAGRIPEGVVAGWAAPEEAAGEGAADGSAGGSAEGAAGAGLRSGPGGS